mmetsp:Transcript_98002/g.281581  ORF Transcript_98002/g.281581 Transcript_98002/m.281581 type:complete len:232 (+) Transcript_98002:310-1005(+)
MGGGPDGNRQLRRLAQDGPGPLQYSLPGPVGGGRGRGREGPGGVPHLGPQRDLRRGGLPLVPGPAPERRHVAGLRHGAWQAPQGDGLRVVAWRQLSQQVARVPLAVPVAGAPAHGHRDVQRPRALAQVQARGLPQRHQDSEDIVQLAGDCQNRRLRPGLRIQAPERAVQGRGGARRYGRLRGARVRRDEHRDGGERGLFSRHGVAGVVDRPLARAARGGVEGRVDFSVGRH